MMIYNDREGILINMDAVRAVYLLPSEFDNTDLVVEYKNANTAISDDTGTETVARYNTYQEATKALYKLLRLLDEAEVLMKV